MGERRPLPEDLPGKTYLGGERDEAEEIGPLLLPAHEQAAEAVEPAVAILPKLLPTA